MSMNWQAVVDKTVSGLGYELVECDRGARGLLRVFIDRVPGRSYPTGESEFVTVEDCETVTRQLQYVLEVEACDYSRLEVSSPGLDRVLKKAADFERFTGQRIDLTLKLPFQGRKKYQGVLQAAVAAEPVVTSEAVAVGGEAGWALHFHDGQADQVLGFTLDELREARLVPVVNFKGRERRPAGVAAEEAAARQEHGGLEE